MKASQVTLAPGVRLRNERLHDPVRNKDWPLNKTASFILGQLPTTVEDLGSRVAEHFGIPRAVAEQETLRFVTLLQRRLLVNLQRHRGGVLVEFCQVTLPAMAFGAYAPPPSSRRRYAAHTHSYRAIVGSVTRALLRPALTITLATAIVLFSLLTLVGAAQPDVIAVLAATMGLGVVVHEVGHALALRGVPLAVAVRGLRPSLVHQPLPSRRAALAAVGGPIAGLVVGAGLLVPGLLLQNGSIGLAAIVTASQGVGLTCLASDGRNLCRAM